MIQFIHTYSVTEVQICVDENYEIYENRKLNKPFKVMIACYIDRKGQYRNIITNKVVTPAKA